MDTYGGLKEFFGGWHLGNSTIEVEDVDFLDAAAKRMLFGTKTVTLPDGTVLKDQPAYRKYITSDEKEALEQKAKLDWVYFANFYESSQLEVKCLFDNCL